MTEKHHLRKLQKHGTGRESHYPPEVCEALGIDAGDYVDFVIGPGNNVALRKPSTAETIEQDQQQVNSSMDPEKMITLFNSKHGCIISGKRNCGKMYYAENLCLCRKRLIVYDTLGEYTQGVFFEDLQEFESYWAHVQHGNFRIIYRPLDPELDFDSICELVNESEDLTFLIEQLDWYCEPSMSLPLKKLIRDGCDKKIELIATTQKPQAIDKRLINNAGQIYQLVSLPTQSNPELEAALSDDH